MQIGIDFGTTHTAAAYYDGRRLQFIPLDPQNKEPTLLRSMLYMTREQEEVIGMEAVERYLRENTGRYTRYETKTVGTIENVVSRVSRGPLEPDGPIHLVYDVVVEEDVGAPGRLIQSIKAALGDPEYAGTTIYGRFVSIQELVAILLRHVRQQAEKHLQQPVTTAVLGRPVRFAMEKAEDVLAEERLREAAALAGLTNVVFELEPLAAAHFYAQEQLDPQTVLVFDFGGGTLDLTIMRTGQPPVILATHGVLVGGDDLDRALMRNRVAAYFGAGQAMDREGNPFPSHLAARLERWQTIPDLSRPQHLSIIRRAKERSPDSHRFAALECLVTKNYGFTLFERIEQTKRALSVAEEAQLEMRAEVINLRESITRTAFQRAIIDEIGNVSLGLNELLASASLRPPEIDVVVTTGGSSLVPVFQEMLKRRFPAATQVRSDTFGSVTAGLALQAQNVAWQL